MTFRFLYPWAFLALLAIPLMVALYYLLEKKGRPRIIYSDLTALKSIAPSPRVRYRHVLLGLRCLAVALLAVALARPQYGNRTQEYLSKGIDIMIVLDVSTSMSQRDMEPNRLAAAKQVVKRFIEGRRESKQNDRIGLVSFSRVSFTKCPLTVDHTILKRIVSYLGFAEKEFDGTAIGTALATAVARLKDSPAKSKVIILVTDGENNHGLDPMTAASMAETMGIKVYTIGVVPVGFMQEVQDQIFGKRYHPAPSNVDESQMKRISESTGGKYFRAENRQGLREIFGEIDEMEKTEVKVKEYYRYTEAYGPWAVAALLLLGLEMFLRHTAFRKIP
ncbi:MAG: VWA domain-containing protein [bacterium]